MRNHGRRTIGQAANSISMRLPVISLALIMSISVMSGCSGTISTKPHAQIRKVDAATNILNTQNHNADTSIVAVNGADTFITTGYGTASSYLFLESGSSTFQGSSTLTLPKVGTSSTTITPKVVSYNLMDGLKYTSYLIGRPDVANPTQADLSDIDPRFLSVIILADNQSVPAAGQATVRVVNGACDAGNITVQVDGTAPSAFTNVPYATLSTPSTSDVSVAAGTRTITVATTNPASSFSKQITFSAGSKYTLVVNEPTAAPTPAVFGVQATSPTYDILQVAN